MEYVRTLTRELATGPSASLEVENRGGAVTVRGEATGHVRVEVVARVWAESDAEADDQAELIDRNIRQDGARVTVRAPALLRPASLLALLTRVPRIDYQITVPTATHATIDSRSGTIEVGQIDGPLEIEARSGRVALSEIGADTKLQARSGAVQAEGIAGNLTIESRSGRVQVRRCGGDVTVTSRSGAVQVEDVTGDLRVGSRSGAVAVTNAGRDLNVGSRSGAVRYEGPVRGRFDIDVSSGSVLLVADRDSAFFLDAETLSGAVHSDMPLRRPGAGGAHNEGAKVRIRTRSGSIRIVPR